jgi:hypothetical protein
MSHSQLLTVELPDASGKTVPFYTYDGYLEENDRHKIHKETHGVDKLKVTGGAFIGLANFAVIVRTFSLQEDCRFQSLVSEDSLSPLPDYFQVSSEESLAMTSSPSMETHVSPLFNANSSCLPSIYPFGRTQDAQSTPTEPFRVSRR